MVLPKRKPGAQSLAGQANDFISSLRFLGADHRPRLLSTESEGRARRALVTRATPQPLCSRVRTELAVVLSPPEC